jgi:predicted Zn-dependent protease with MMP-like domain
MSDKEFEDIVGEAIDSVPEPYKSRLNNIAFLIEDEPNADQRQKLGLHPGQTLFGLYEGVPLPQRGGTTKLLPDKITVFKNPILMTNQTDEEIKRQVANTIWHEVAHYFGLDHRRIHELEQK